LMEVMVTRLVKSHAPPPIPCGGCSGSTTLTTVSATTATPAAAAAPAVPAGPADTGEMGESTSPPPSTCTSSNAPMLSPEWGRMNTAQGECQECKE
jgi:hypothetical protein